MDTKETAVIAVLREIFRNTRHETDITIAEARMIIDVINEIDSQPEQEKLP